MPRDGPPEAAGGLGVDGHLAVDTEATGASPASTRSEAFLRELAHVSDQPPSALGLQLAPDRERFGSQDQAAGPSSSRFLIRRRLGAGGFGVVYEALDRERNATVALKVLRRRDGLSITRFKTEFRSLAETVHPNLVQLYELHAEGDEWLFTMELIRGKAALEYVRPAGGTFHEQRLRAVFRQIAEGLSFLHGANKLHRDVKPSNVMVTEDGRVVIVDFGLVSDVRQTFERGVFGTPAYMAPEQAAGQPVTAAADWYAVGVMLYQALAGCLPVRPGQQSAISTASIATPEEPTEADGSSSVLAFDPAAAELAPPLPPSTIVTGVPGDLDRLCVELLARDPAERPTGKDICRRLALPESDPESDSLAGRRAGRPGGEAPFVGRETQLAALREALAAAEAGTAVTVFIHGPSGMGKSALVQRFLSEVRANDPERLVLFGRCFEQESVPYKGVDGLVDDLCRRLWDRPRWEIEALLPPDFPVLARLFPQLEGWRGGDPDQQSGNALPALEGTDHRQLAFAALRELIVRASPRTPVLVVDDLQWGDLDSTALLVAMLQAPRPTPILLLTTYRADEERSNPVLLSFFEALGALTDRVDVRRVDVDALDDGDAAALSRTLLEADPEAGKALAIQAIAALVAEAHGDPFLLTEFARHDRGERRPGETATTGGGLGGLLTSRISRLPEPARRLLEILALDGQPISRSVAMRAAWGADGEGDSFAAISVLRAGHLIRSRRSEGGDEIMPYHDRIREVVTQTLDPETKRAHHDRLAHALETTGNAEPERLLFHYRGAGRLADAVRLAADAARRAHEALAFERAARLYREVLALVVSSTDGQSGARPLTPAEHRALLVSLADALAGAWRPREAALAYLEAVKGADPTETLDRSRRAAELLLGAGYTDEGLTTLRSVLHDVGVPLHPTVSRSLLGFAALRVRLRVRGLEYRERPESAIGRRELLRLDACYAAAIGLFQVNPTLAAESMARHLFVALQVGEPFRVARALGFEALFQANGKGSTPRSARLLEMAQRIEAREGRPRLSGLLRLIEALFSQMSAQWARAHRLVVESESILVRHGDTSEVDLARWLHPQSLWATGQIAELSRVLPTFLQGARERGSRFLEMMLQLSVKPIVHLTAGRPDLARETVAMAVARWPHPRGSFLHGREIAASARIALYEGRGADALAQIDEGLVAMRRTGQILARSPVDELRMLGGLAALSLGEDARVARFARTLSHRSAPWARTAALFLRAGLAQRAGETEGAIAGLRQTREDARSRGAALVEAAMSRRLGDLLGGSEGRALIEEADGWMTRQGLAEPQRIAAMLIGSPADATRRRRGGWRAFPPRSVSP